MRSTSKLILPALLAACLVLAGCYQAKMTTNKEPGNTVVEKKWASSYIYGIVPAEVDVSDQCPNGVASAEREISFLNGLVSQLTVGIYLPQTVTVTCAAGGAMSHATTPENFVVPSSATPAEMQKTLSEAATQARFTKEPATVRVLTE